MLGGGPPTMEDVAGFYDLVSPQGSDGSSTIEIRSNGSGTLTDSPPGETATVIHGHISIVGEEDGCILLEAREEGGGDSDAWKLCDETLTVGVYLGEAQYQKRD
jgi:hypothetical protein